MLETFKISTILINQGLAVFMFLIALNKIVIQLVPNIENYFKFWNSAFVHKNIKLICYNRPSIVQNKLS